MKSQGIELNSELMPPVLVIGFNRAELLIRRLNQISQFRTPPQKVFVSIDGPRNPEDATSILEFDRKYKDLVLPFEVEVIKRANNLGCSKHIIDAVTEVLRAHGEVVVIEDDIVLSANFYDAMKEGLSYIRSNPEIGTVGAFSPFHSIPLLTKKRTPNVWRESQYFSAWGWATNAGFWETFKEIGEIENLERFLSESASWKKLSSRKQKIWLTRFRRGIWDYNVQLNLFAQSRANLLPIFRMIDNEGFSDQRSTHTKHARPWNLFGIGLTETIPKFSRISKFYFFKIIWGFFDANLWAADGLLNARARQKGVRTFLREYFKLN